MSLVGLKAFKGKPGGEFTELRESIVAKCVKQRVTHTERRLRVSECPSLAWSAELAVQAEET